ncbi:MAG: DUF2779 domain-containing protein [Fodinibius sp.]|nr:DUF2779 domain-containing protein [Fodinibius sp.]
MSRSRKTKDYFTKHLFGAGIECATKLYYYSQNYPENRESRPFIEHAVFNKRLLKALTRSAYPHGIFVDEPSVAQAAQKTAGYLDREQVTLFDAVFEDRRMMARLPIIDKEGQILTAYHVQAKGFDSRKHRLYDSNGSIHSKWRSYLLDFAYQLFLLKKIYPEYELKALLVMPEKSGQAYTDNLPALLHPLEKGTISDEVLPANQELLAKIDVTDLIVKVWEDAAFAEEHLPQESFEQSVDYLRNLYFNEEKVNPQIGLKCSRCEFRTELTRIKQGTKSGFNECWSPHMSTDNPTESHVFDLIGPGTNKWVMNGVRDQRDIALDNIISPESILKGNGRISHEMRQALQIYKKQGYEVPEEIYRPAIARELQRWEYPLHFLDFEAGNYAVPVRKSRSPYHLVLFQFSCHTLRSDGSWTHHQWIDDRNSGYPSYQLVRRLMKVPDIESGTIVQYSNFERNALKTIRRELISEQHEVSDAEALIGWIQQIIDRNDSSHQNPPYVADLSRLVKNFYYNREMGNSLSIKDVLQSVMSYSDFLKAQYSQPYSSRNFDEMRWWQPNGSDGARNPYKLLMETGDAPIRRGTEAMVVYGKMIAQQWSADKMAAFRQALLKYCELDTLAMMMIYQHWHYKLLADR